MQYLFSKIHLLFFACLINHNIGRHGGDSMNYRLGTRADIPVMAQIRKQQLIDEGISPDISIDEELLRYFDAKLSDGSLVEWLVEDEGEVVATAAILFLDFPPTYTNRSGIRGYITNMYTAPSYRGKGVATSMLEKLIDEARSRSVNKIFLSASTLGKPVYKKFGFIEKDQWMELDL